MKININNLEDTKAFAQKFGKTLQGGDIVVLSGDLGAGKTTFTQFLAKFLGVEDPVTSPTYTLMNQYVGENLKLYHFDMYRIEDVFEVLETGLTEYFGNKDAVCVVEWAENIRSLLPQNLTIVTIKKLDETKRKFIVQKGSL